MNEAEWCRSTYPSEMLLPLRNRKKQLRPSRRKLRLYCCACCRSIWHLLSPEFHQAVQAAELYFDGRIDADTFKAEWPVGDRDFWDRCDAWAVGLTIWPRRYAEESVAVEVARLVSLTNQRHCGKTLHRQLGILLRDIAGNLFRPAVIDPAWLAWNDGTVVKLAQTIYEERELPSGHFDGGRLAILADALEEAGCADAEPLSHLRGPGPHVRGCHVTDAILGKE